jgi:hypothetical protein
MLSIRFDSKSEWWVSSGIFERLFKTAIQSGSMPAHLEQWLQAADANGGLALSKIPADEAAQLTAALRSTAKSEVQRLKDAATPSPDGAYCVSLRKLLALDFQAS